MKVFVLKLWEWMLVAFLFLLPWQTRLILRPGVLNGGNWEYGIIGVYGTEMLLWLVLLFWLIYVIASEAKQSHSWTGLLRFARNIVLRRDCFVALLLIMTVVVNFLVASDRLVAFQSWRYILEAIIVLFLIRRHSRTGWLIGAFLSGLAVQSILAIWQFLVQDTFASRWLGLVSHPAWQAGSAVLENSTGRWLRAYGGLPHPNILGGYLALGLVIIVALSRCHIIKNKKYLIFNIQYLIYCLLFTALFFTFSRGALLAFATVLLLFGFIALRNKKYLISNIQYLISISLILFVILSLLFSPLLYSRFSGVGRLEVYSTEQRLSGYHEAWSLFKKHPLFGVGLGNYTLAVRQELDASRPSYLYQPVHNIFLLMTVELGLVGLVLFCLFIFYFGKIFNIKYLIFNIFVLFFILGLFDHYLWSLYSGWMLLAVGGGLALSGQAKDAKI